MNTQYPEGMEGKILPKNTRLFLEIELKDGKWLATSSVFGGEKYRIRSYESVLYPADAWDRIERKHYDEDYGHRMDSALKKSCHNHAVLGFVGGIFFILFAIAMVQLMGRMR